MNICCITIIKPYFCTHEKKQLYIGVLSVACCALVAIGITLHLLYPKKQIQNLVKNPPVLRLKPQPADTLKKKPVKKMDFNISGTLRDKEGKGVAGVIVSDGFNCVKPMHRADIR